MCGIAGILNLDGKNVSTGLLKNFSEKLKHRGPDDEGYILIDTSTGRHEARHGDDTYPELKPGSKYISDPVDFKYNMAFAHRRLSIIDLSSAGHQPMSNEDGTIWIVYNGEIYNYPEITKDLKNLGHVFKSRTDTEVILHSYEEWGEDCLSRFNGMWAFAIWDGRKKQLFCSRDRFGIKPFYYYFDGNSFVFASEIKAILQADFVKSKPNDKIVQDYLELGLIDHTEDTFFQGVKRLENSHYLIIEPGNRRFTIQRYYDIPQVEPKKGKEYAENFLQLFEDSIRLRLISDVPVGSCLSGGLDSSSIVCVLDKQVRENGYVQKTLSARYDDPLYDEGIYIQDVVKRTKVKDYYIYPTSGGLWEDISKLVWYQEEPFGSTSIYSQWEVFKLAKSKGVTVVLGGQGADELLAGYTSYDHFLLAQLFTSFKWRSFLSEVGSMVKFQDSKTSAYQLLQTLSLLIKEKSNRKPYLNQALYTGLMTTSLPVLLRYEDKNSMAHSIESRVPFLDYCLVEFASALPWTQKIYHGVSKVVLRNAMRGIVPESVLRRRTKVGFSTPGDTWFRGPLADKITDIINSKSFKERPYWEYPKVIKAFADPHTASSRIWGWVNLELWLREFIDGRDR